MNAVLPAVSKTLNVGKHSNVYESRCFKLCMMIDTVRLYITISV